MTSSTARVQPTVDVGEDALRLATKHGMELFWDGSTPTKRLDRRGDHGEFSRYVNARIEGKLAEVAFSQFLETEFHIKSDVDWRIYGDYNVTDYADVRCLYDDLGNEVRPGVAFDVKKTKSWNSWLAIRSSMFERHEDDAPIILTTMDLQDDMDLRQYEPWDEFPEDDPQFESMLAEFVDENFPLSVQIMGAVYKDEFTHTFDQGERLFDPNNPSRKFNARMRMDNHAVPVQDLDASVERWNRVAGEIVGQNQITWLPMHANT